MGLARAPSFSAEACRPRIGRYCRTRTNEENSAFMRRPLLCVPFHFAYLMMSAIRNCPRHAYMPNLTSSYHAANSSGDVCLNVLFIVLTPDQSILKYVVWRSSAHNDPAACTIHAIYITQPYLLETRDVVHIQHTTHLSTSPAQHPPAIHSNTPYTTKALQRSKNQPSSLCKRQMSPWSYFVEFTNPSQHQVSRRSSVTHYTLEIHPSRPVQYLTPSFQECPARPR